MFSSRTAISIAVFDGPIAVGALGILTFIAMTAWHRFLPDDDLCPLWKMEKNIKAFGLSNTSEILERVSSWLLQIAPCLSDVRNTACYYVCSDLKISAVLLTP